MAQYKDKLLEEYNNGPINIGEQVSFIIKKTGYETVGRGKNKHQVEVKKPVRMNGEVYNSDGVMVAIKYKENSWNANEEIIVLDRKDVTRHNEIFVGANPFDEKHWTKCIETNNYPLGSVCSILNIERFKKYHDPWIVEGQNIEDYNDDPFVVGSDGNKYYYQRGYVWTLEQKRNLIRSIFNFLDCGNIIIRKRTDKWVMNEIKNGNTSARLIEIVDGKQRINALKSYINNEFDVDGIYYSDLSEVAVREFDMVHPFTVSSFRENADDADVIKAFLNVNFAGTQCSQEHIEYVKSINKKCKYD